PPPVTPPPVTPPVVVSTQTYPVSPTPVVVVAALAPGVDLVVFGEGVRMPVLEEAPGAPTPGPESAPAPGPEAAPAPARPAPALPVFAPKQDRN
ncbi:MAG: hypothetical protein Q7T61_15400, partial [Caulobacter sp.]|nr:hypothetical protein [Caulobacter sp.]